MGYKIELWRRKAIWVIRRPYIWFRHYILGRTYCVGVDHGLLYDYVAEGYRDRKGIYHLTKQYSIPTNQPPTAAKEG